MIFAAWNVIGLNEPLKITEVKHFLNVHNIHVCGLFETKVKEIRWATKSAYFGVNWRWSANYDSHRKG